MSLKVGQKVTFAYKVRELPRNGNSHSYDFKFTGLNYHDLWAVACQVNDSTVEFGFEDNSDYNTSDFDMNDIIFRVQGIAIKPARKLRYQIIK